LHAGGQGRALARGQPAGGMGCGKFWGFDLNVRRGQGPRPWQSRYCRRCAKGRSGLIDATLEFLGACGAFGASSPRRRLYPHQPSTTP
jgi:hypothetical protein